MSVGSSARCDSPADRADILIDKNALAERLGLSHPARVHVLLARAELPLPQPVYIAPRSPRWRLSDIDAWLEACADSGWGDAASAHGQRLQAARSGTEPKAPRGAPRPPVEPGLLRLKHAVRYLDVSRTVFFQLKRAGELPAPVVFSARDLRWRKSELDAWLAARQGVRHEPPPAEALEGRTGTHGRDDGAPSRHLRHRSDDGPRGQTPIPAPSPASARRTRVRRAVEEAIEEQRLRSEAELPAAKEVTP